MKRLVSSTHDLKRLFGWIGTISLVLIIPVKAMRWMDETLALKILTDIAPSVLGPAGLLFLMLSTSGRLARLSLLQTTLLVGVIALGFEFAQLLPRPGILAKLYYTFDWLDVIASLLSIIIGYVFARVIIRTKTRTDNLR